jgi:calcium-independent phospholipase A2-gamma
MLGRMRMPVDKCIAEYQSLGKVVFGKPRGVPHEHMFDAAVLEEQAKQVVKKYLGDENAPLLDPLGEDACKT